MANAVDHLAERPAPKINTLESIRGLAATLVVVHHVPDWNSNIWDIHVIRDKINIPKGPGETV